MSIELAEADARRGLEYIRKGKSGKLKDPEYVLQKAAEAYTKASNGLVEPAADASKDEKKTYTNVRSLVDILQSELASYAKGKVGGLTKEAGGYVSGITKLVKQEERGKRILGVPYAKRPSVAYVSGKIEQGKTYVTQALGKVGAMRKILENEALLKPAEKNMLNEAKGALEQVNTKLGELETQNQNAGKAVKPKTKKKDDGKGGLHLPHVKLPSFKRKPKGWQSRGGF
ncbi:MAG: hypothetical protein HYT71_01295 [Candidatus Aenigmarchaeota archaeon]|nr:hypothetical protein [Candidatus Aenigmarchaeota archaeon]